MTDSKNKIENAKNKIVGEVKEAIGKVTNNEELELKGKIQSSIADTKEKAYDLKDDITKKINDNIDKSKDNDNSK